MSLVSENKNDLQGGCVVPYQLLCEGKKSNIAPVLI
jgi:hypothetical protein